MLPATFSSSTNPTRQAAVRTGNFFDLHATTALGAQLLVNRNTPGALLDGTTLLTEAARRGDARAWGYIAMLAAAGIGRDQSWLDAFSALDQSASLGDLQSTRQLQVLRETGICNHTDADDWCRSATGRTLSHAPRLVAYADFLPPSLCAHLISYTTPKLVRARVRDVHSGELKEDAMRTNTGVALSFIDTDLIFQLIRCRIAHAAGIAVATIEPPEILHYSVGEQYRPHVDFFHPAVPHFANQIRQQGQRIKTCLVYLNDQFEGGGTDFPRLGLTFRGGAGEALIFENVRPDGNVDMDTVHAGTPPARGEKWLLSQWIRDKPQPLR